MSAPAPTTDQPEIDLELVYTVAEAAAELKLGTSTTRERIASGKLRSFKDGGRRLVAGVDLLAYIEARREESA